ncbi:MULTISPECIES: MarR family winged helix-turn-helix transcriptional regulator [unclassified Arthrobacter]|uniref:MarR family winged helix-turn-helix transcriptional regulator n=1 Tax=unclassified Arthrobacter TaxID=235627 RepID=UPI0024E01BEE|nr:MULTISPECIES: MarR family winged helix-turn-helix transcriptional regulator [unclassified Arthrobacter]MCC9146746.1 MarR family winged helix-turn-helix transcriptional regulator [Arthrobacter sp. zg-Y919]MDK1277977.1 MarR family winged helix-turn-helix transcriptional regulator [Arthrobacter sp. zg.Y919]WIB03430.1 MarR family winged helix-turn-helix transcriptional regulator [Arthrobacter sp. zg-Y919]
MNTPNQPADGYWYASSPEHPKAREVLEAVRSYRAAETRIRRRTQDAMGMNENDLLAMRYLMQARQTGGSLGPKDLSRLLGISTASTTALIDRLERGGYVQRRARPHDRRAWEIVPTDTSDTEVRATVGTMHQRMMQAAAELSPQDAETVIRFMDRLREALDAPATAPTPPHQ